MRPWAGTRILQSFYESLLMIALTGMHIGGGAEVAESGERSVLKYVRKRIIGREKPLVVDAGANVGGYSLLAQQILGSDVLIHAFEPSHVAFERLCEAVKIFENIYPHNIGLGNVSTATVLYSESEASGRASLYDRRMGHYDVVLDKKETVNIETLDEFCLKNGIERIDFLKLDIEGHELKALQGAARMLGEGRIDMIQFEFGQCNIDSRTFFQDFFYLLKDTYRISRVLKNGLRPIPEYRESLEQFRRTSNFFAQRIGG